MPSASIISLIVLVLANVLPKIGVNVGGEQLTSAIEVILTVVTGVIIWVRHVSLKKEALGSANVNAFGGVKK